MPILRILRRVRIIVDIVICVGRMEELGQSNTVPTLRLR